MSALVCAAPFFCTYRVRPAAPPPPNVVPCHSQAGAAVRWISRRCWGSSLLPHEQPRDATPQVPPGQAGAIFKQECIQDENVQEQATDSAEKREHGSRQRGELRDRLWGVVGGPRADLLRGSSLWNSGRLSLAGTVPIWLQALSATSRASIESPFDRWKAT